MPAECCRNFWKRIADDEPVFTIAARDLLAVPVIREWIRRAEQAGVPADKIDRALDHLEAIEEFQDRNRDRCHLPD